MKYIIALFLSFGMLHFTMAQNENSPMYKNAPADANPQSELDGTARSYENEDRSYMDENQSKLQESDMNSSSTQNEFNQNNEFNIEAAAPAANTVTTNTEVVKVEKKDGLLENIVEAPFKFVGHTVAGVGEGVWDISKGVGKGVGRIVAAPFKGLGKALGIGGNKKTEVTQSSVTTVEPATQPAIMDESAKATDTEDVIIEEECM